MWGSNNDRYADDLLRAVEESLFGGQADASSFLRESVASGGITPSFVDGYVDLAARELRELRRTRRHGSPAREPRLFTALVSALENAEAWTALAPAIRSIMIAEALDAHTDRSPRIADRCPSTGAPSSIRLDPSLSSMFHSRIARAAAARCGKLREAAFEAALSMLDPPTRNPDACTAFLAPHIAAFRGASGPSSFAWTRELIDTANRVFDRSQGEPPIALVRALVLPLFSRAAALASSRANEERRLGAEMCFELRCLAERHPIDLSGCSEARASLSELLAHLERGAPECRPEAARALLSLLHLLRASGDSFITELCRAVARSSMPQPDAASIKISIALELCHRAPASALSLLVGEICTLISGHQPSAVHESALELLVALPDGCVTDGAANLLLRSLLRAMSGRPEDERRAAFSKLMCLIGERIGADPSYELESTVAAAIRGETFDERRGLVDPLIAWMGDCVEERILWPDSTRSLVLDALVPLIERLAREAMEGEPEGRVLDAMQRISVVRRFLSYWAEGIDLGSSASDALASLDRAVLSFAARGEGGYAPADAEGKTSDDSVQSIVARLEVTPQPSLRRALFESLAKLEPPRFEILVPMFRRAMAIEPAESSVSMTRAAAALVFDELEAASNPAPDAALSLARRVEGAYVGLPFDPPLPAQSLLVDSVRVLRARGLESWLSLSLPGRPPGRGERPDETCRSAAQGLLRNACLLLHFACIESERRPSTASDPGGASALSDALRMAVKDSLARVPLNELGVVGSLISEGEEEMTSGPLAEELGFWGTDSLFRRFERRTIDQFAMRYRSVLTRLGAESPPGGRCELARLLGEGRRALGADELEALEREFERSVCRPISRLYSSYVRGFLATDLRSPRPERVALLRGLGFYERLAEWGLSPDEEVARDDEPRMLA